MDNTTANTNFISGSGTIDLPSNTYWNSGPSVLDSLEQKVRILLDIIRNSGIALSNTSSDISELAKAALLKELKDYFGDLLAVPQEHQEAQAEANRFFNRETR